MTSKNGVVICSLCFLLFFALVFVNIGSALLPLPGVTIYYYSLDMIVITIILTYNKLMNLNTSET
jgi:hypothetical protein